MKAAAGLTRIIGPMPTALSTKIVAQKEEPPGEVAQRLPVVRQATIESQRTSGDVMIS